MNLPDRRQTKGIRERKIQENGVEVVLVDVRKAVRGRSRVRDLEFFYAPFREQILREPRIDIVIFDQQYGDHAKDSRPFLVRLLRNRL
jgi:hypothetical protein